MELINIKPIRAGSGISLFEVFLALANGSGVSITKSIMDVALVANVASVNLIVGHRRPGVPERPGDTVASVVAYMHTQDYQLLSHMLYVGEEVKGWDGNWIYMSAVFQKSA